MNQHISGDELGINTARLGDVVLRSAFQLIFARRGNALEAVAAEGFLRPVREGMALAPQDYLAALGEEERAYASGLAALLHLLNHRHIGLDGLDHVVSLRNEDRSFDWRVLADRLDDAELDASQLVYHLRAPERFDAFTLRVHAGRAKAIGARIALGPSDQPHLSAIREVAPDVVAIGGSWFARVCGNAAAARLFLLLARGFRRQGLRVWIEDIETVGQLKTALDAEADMMSGPLLSQPRAVGSDVNGVFSLASVLEAGQDGGEAGRRGATSRHRD